MLICYFGRLLCYTTFTFSLKQINKNLNILIPQFFNAFIHFGTFISFLFLVFGTFIIFWFFKSLTLVFLKLQLIFKKTVLKNYVMWVKDNRSRYDKLCHAGQTVLIFVKSMIDIVTNHQMSASAITFYEWGESLLIKNSILILLLLSKQNNGGLVKWSFLFQKWSTFLSWCSGAHIQTRQLLYRFVCIWQSAG